MLTSNLALKLSDVNQVAYDLIHIMDEYTITSLLYDIVICFDLLKSGGILIVGEWHDRAKISMSTVIDFVSAVFTDKISKTYHIRDEIIIIKK